MQSTALKLVPQVERVLHLGCGRKGRNVPIIGIDPDIVTTLDAEPLVHPDIVCVLGQQSIPLDSDSIDLAVAYHVLEHIGKQGETGEWFYFWEELYRVLRPGGRLIFESPLYNSVWCWADPQHVRALSPQALVYFEQSSYRIPGSAITPYRIRCDFSLDGFEGIPDGNAQVREQETFSHFRGTMSAIKPFRPHWEDVEDDGA